MPFLLQHRPEEHLCTSRTAITVTFLITQDMQYPKDEVARSLRSLMDNEAASRIRQDIEKLAPSHHGSTSQFYGCAACE